MSKNNENKLVPKLRFPEFVNDGEWKEKKLIDVCEINPKVSQLPDEFVYIDLESVDKGKLLQKKIINKDEAPSRAQRLLEENDVVYQTVRPYQKNNYHFKKNDDYEYVASTGYAQLRVFQSSSFLFQLIHTDNFVSQVIKKCSGSNYPAINSSDLSQIALAIPTNINEQKKIADCLSSLDEVIISENEKLVALQDHKNGLLQNLFTKDGESFPKFRFSDFEDSGDWEETTLSQVADYENGKAHEQDIADDGEFIVVNSKFISQDGEVKKFTNTAFLPATKGDVLMVLSDIPNGRAIAKCFLVEEDNRYTVNQRICRITPRNLNSKILYYLLNRNPYFLTFDDGVKQTNLRKEDVLNCPLMIPSNPKEQEMIADTLSSVDDLINAQNQKLDSLQLHKKGLLQGLFPTINNEE
ncbi:MAG: restriction endonuclease subunit S [Bacteroidota bacterium]|jgi:type I restriction enzyme S subunit